MSRPNTGKTPPRILAAKKKYKLSQIGKPCTYCGVCDRTPGGTCRPCSRRINNARYKRNSLPMRQKAEQSKYGISREGREALFDAQDGKCKFCHEALEAARARNCVIDHDHVTNTVRGLVHQRCNIAIATLDRLRNEPEFKALAENYYVND